MVTGSAKSDRERLSTVIFHLFESIKIVSVLTWPFMPDASEKIQAFLGLPRKGNALKIEDIRDWGGMKSGGTARKAPPLFPRIEPKGEKKPVEPADKKKEQKKESDLISYREFQRLDLRIGSILEAEAVPKSKKLLKLTVDIGEERTVVAGIKEHYEPDQLIGKQVILVANLEPAKLMGVESQGMVLAAEDDRGVHLLLTDSDTDPGSRVR